MPLMTYRQAKKWAKAIAEVTQSRKMPPWFADPTVGHFSDDPSLTPEQIATLRAWRMPERRRGARAMLRLLRGGWKVGRSLCRMLS